MLKSIIRIGMLSRKRYLIPVVLFGSLAVYYFSSLIFNSHQGTSIQDQIAMHGDKTLDEINALPKYDRPDLAVMQNFDMTQDPALNAVPTQRTVQTFENLKKNNFAGRAALSGVNWDERGPNNIGGRTRTVMFDPNDGSNQKVWAGSVGGGLWYNNNITSSSTQWQSIDDFWATLAITTMAYDPSNTQTFYVGTGEGFYNADAVRGAGIWKSTNGGTSWSQLSSTDNADFHYVQKVVVTSSGTILAATRTGLFRSTNGGTSWSAVSTAGRYADIEIAANGDIYASQGILTTGILYKSTNDGVSYTDVTPATGGERIEIACAPSDANTLYAVASTGSDVAWFRKSTNGGSSWSTVNIPNYRSQSCTNSGQDFTRSQAWYDLIMAVHPTNPNIVLVGGIDIHRSTNGGSSWTSVSYWTGSCADYVHADQHAMAFRPGNSNQAIFGNDGGVSYSSNVGNSSSTPSFDDRNNGYNVTQFYAADQVNTSGSNIMLAGAQDNGSHRYSSAGVNSTNEVTGGDGAFCHIDQDNGNYQITSYVYNNFYRSTNGGSSFSGINHSYTSNGRFINPTEYDDGANILYSAGNEDQYIRISNITGFPSTSAVSVSLGGFRASAIKVSPYTNNRIFVATGTNRGTGGSKIFRIDNANGSPSSTEIGTASIPADAYISSIDVGSSDNQIIITLSNYGVVSVWETRNGGSSWSNREGNLPDIPVRWVLYNPNNTNEVLLATELGVWSTDNVDVASPVWGVTNTGLANVRTDMLQYRDSDGQVVVATHGRGVYTGQPFTSGGDTEAPTQPTSLSASNVGTNSFDVSWTASTDNVGVVNYTVSLDGSVQGTTASTSYSFSGLSSNTTYNVSVVANDAAGNNSTAASINVTTGTTGPCSGGITAFPYNESFENTLGAWSQSSSDDIDWTVDASGTPSSGTGPSAATAGTYYIYMEVSGNGTGFPSKRAILNGPCFDLSGQSAAIVAFDYHMTGNAVGTVDLEISTNSGSSWTSVWTRSGDQGANWNNASVDLSSYVGGSFQLRYNGISGSSWQGDIAIDNFELTTGTTDTEAPTTPTGLASSNITTSGFDVNWTASTDNVGVVNYTVSLDGSVQGTTTSTNYNFSGLASGTSYNVSVVANDAAGNNSAAASINVSTTSTGSCTGGISAFPYNESFENTIGAWTQSSADDLDWTVDSNGTPSNGTGPSTATDGTYYIYMEVSGDGTGFPNKRAILTSPCFDFTGETSGAVAFDYHMTGSNVGTINLEISTNNGSSWSSIWSLSGDQGANWGSANVDLTSYAGNSFQLRLNGLSGSSWQGDIAIDKLSVTNGTTPPPTYCASQGNDSSYEWIANVTVGSFSNNSGAANYTDNTGTTVSVGTGSTAVSFSPGFSGSTYTEFWKIWVDLNVDGDFDDANELVFDGGSSTSTVTGNMTIPTSAAGTTTRMRVSMKYNGAQTSCEAFAYGEVEDYTISISGGTMPAGTANFDFPEDNHITVEGIFQVYPNPAPSDVLNVVSERFGSNVTLSIYDMTGARKMAFKLSEHLRTGIDISKLNAGIYIIALHDGRETITKKFVKR